MKKKFTDDLSPAQIMSTTGSSFWLHGKHLFAIWPDLNPLTWDQQSILLPTVLPMRVNNAIRLQDPVWNGIFKAYHQAITVLDAIKVFLIKI
jgi:hypothetical protein